MNPHLFLTPIQPSNPGFKGKLPHKKYRLIRSQAEEIIRARDSRGWSNNYAAKVFGLGSPKEYSKAYDLLKENGRHIVERGDWSGVEAAIYGRNPTYRGTQAFRDILVDFNDPRAGA